MRARVRPAFFFFAAIFALAVSAPGQGTGFSYQGHLLENDAAANGAHDFTFALFDSAGAGNQIGPILTVTNAPVTNGQFNLTLDFKANAFTGQARWLEIGVRRAGVDPFIKMDARVSLLPTPYAIYATTAGTVANSAIAASQLSTAGPAPKAGQVLSFNGGNLFWTDPGVAAGGIWSVLNNNAYYSAGNVGVGGTASGTSKLQVNGSDALTLSGAAPYLTWHDTTSGKNAAISSTLGTLYYRVPNETGNIVTAGYVDSNGSVVRGRLSLEGAGPYITWNDSVSGKSAAISSTLGTLYYRVPNEAGAVVTAGYVDSNGSVVRGRLSLEGAGPFITWNDSTSGKSATISTADGTLNFQVPDAGGKVITALSLDSSGLEIKGALDVTGVTTVTTLRASGVLQAIGTLQANGNAKQAHDKGGFVKAMLTVDGVNGPVSIGRCFNSQKSDNDSTPHCGFQVSRVQDGFYIIDFGFPVNDRFVSITARYLDEDFSSNYNIGANYREGETPSTIQVFTFHTDDPKDTTDAQFTILVY